MTLIFFNFWSFLPLPPWNGVKIQDRCLNNAFVWYFLTEHYWCFGLNPSLLQRSILCTGERSAVYQILTNKTSVVLLIQLWSELPADTELLNIPWVWQKYSPLWEPLQQPTWSYTIFKQLSRIQKQPCWLWTTNNRDSAFLLHKFNYST